MRESVGGGVLECEEVRIGVGKCFEVWGKCGEVKGRCKGGLGVVEKCGRRC